MATNAVDHLVFGWTEHGLGNHSGFQVRAASPALRPQSSALTQAALRMCEYTLPSDPKRSSSPAGFGWIDVGSKRIVFNRVGTGVDAFGRSGGFFAHVLIGPRSALPVCLVATWAGSVSFHVDESRLEPGSTTLDPLDPMTVEPGPPPSVEAPAVAALCDRLLDAYEAGRPLVIGGHAEDVADAVRAVMVVLPSAATEGRSFSSYEPLDRAAGFDVVGVEAFGAAAGRVDIHLDELVAKPPASSPLAAGLVGLVSPRRSRFGSNPADAAATVAQAGKSFDVTIYRGAFDVLNGISESTPAPPEMSRLLSTPASAELLLEDVASRRATVNALASGELWGPFASTATRLPPELRSAVATQLGTVAGERFAAGEKVDLHDLVQRGTAISPVFADETAEGMLESLEDAPLALERADARVVELLCVAASVRADLPPPLRAALVDAAARHPRAVLGRPTVDPRFRVDVMGAMAMHGRHDATLAEALTGPEAPLATEVAEVVPADSRAAVLAGMASHLNSHGTVGLVQRFLSRSPSTDELLEASCIGASTLTGRDRLLFMSSWMSQIRSVHSASPTLISRFGELCIDAICRDLEGQVARATHPVALQRAAISVLGPISVADPMAGVWWSIHHELRVNPAATAVRQNALSEMVSKEPDPARRRIAALWCCDSALGAARGLRHAFTVADQLQDHLKLDAAETAQFVLRSAVRHRPWYQPSAYAVIVAARLVDEGSLVPPKFPFRTRDEPYDVVVQLARSALRSVGGDIDALVEEARLGRSAVKWLDRLAPDR